MKCKGCKRELEIPEKAYRNLETYNVGGRCTVASECCGLGYTIEMTVSYKVKPYTGTDTTDEWGYKMTSLK